MSRFARQSVFVLWLGTEVLLVGVWSEIALATGRGQVGKPQDASAPLAERIEREKTGRELFVRDWSKFDPKPAQGGDGLGPMYNDVSCVACHDSGGIGGGGGNNKNVRLLHLVGHKGVPLRVATPSASERNRRQQLHPDLGTATAVMLHRHATTPDDPHSASDPKYQHWLVKRLPTAMIAQDTHSPAEATLPLAFAKPSSPLETQLGTFRSEGRSLRVTERNTTSLFGAGLIDSIPDAAIVELAARQKKQHAPLITGRVSQTASGEIGRFGWRGQMSSLQEFVMTACAAEVGLTVPGHQQSRRVKLPSARDTIPTVLTNIEPNPALDLTQQQCDALTTYVASLPAPQSARATSLVQAKSVQRGEVLFEKVGCAICHVRDVGPATGLFSDLLLHDMGPALSDPQPAMPELKENSTLMPGGGYSGPSLSIELVKNVTTNIHQEWRTPPLWGVASSAPYLHDGRAVSLEQAIQWHGGEGQRAAEAFRALKQDERGDLIQFLDSLAAPNENAVMRFPVNRLPQGGRGSGGGFF